MPRPATKIGGSDEFQKYFRLAALAIAVLALAQFAQAQSDVKICNWSASGGSVRWDLIGYDTGGSLTIAFPDSRSFTKEFKGSSVQFDLTDQKLNGVPDGVYNWEMRVNQSFTSPGHSFTPPGMNHAGLNARRDDEPENERAGRKPAALPPLVQSGTFAVVNGNVIGPGATEGGPQDVASRTQPQQLKARPATSAVVSGNTVTRLRNHRFSLLARPDIVTADDEDIQGSLCVGLDCVNNESFGFDTIRLKENNTRISFNDTSTAAGFPTEDWTIRANSSSSGGGNFLAFVDRGTSETGDESGTIVFEVDAGAPANSLRVSSSGKVGIRTATPVLDVHVNSTDTPAFRMEQNNGGGFTAQIWDIGASEANWFVRDVTGGSRLPLRIRPGAPTSSIDISATGNVGIGTASPVAVLHVVAPSSASGGIQNLDSASTSGGFSAYYDTTGTRTVRGFAGFGTTLFTSGDNTLFGLRSQGAMTFATNGAIRQVTIDTSGNVGIGTTVPDLKLSVSGDADKSVGGGSWQFFSDERLKNIKGRFESGLKAVMQIQPVRFQYKRDNPLGLQSELEQIGFGAQALQKVIPEAVNQNANGYLMVNNDPILWTMLNAIKEQQKEIESLRSQVAKLKVNSHRRHRK